MEKCYKKKYTQNIINLTFHFSIFLEKNNYAILSQNPHKSSLNLKKKKESHSRQYEGKGMFKLEKKRESFKKSFKKEKEPIVPPV